MEEEGEVKAQVRQFNKLDENFEDRDGYVFHKVLSFGPVHDLNNILKILEAQGVDLHDIHRSHFHYFCPDQTLNFPYFVAWCDSNYSQLERVIMDSNWSKIPCPINSLVVRDALEVPQPFP